jgi:hypothetical protein|tara:strand:+ start:85 stop:291 length:207 start_codon:yes stop_codon:yes gene_type:complete
MNFRNLKISNVIGVAVIVVALFGGGFDIIRALVVSGFDSGDFFRGFAVAVIGSGLGLAVIKLGKILQR